MMSLIPANTITDFFRKFENTVLDHQGTPFSMLFRHLTPVTSGQVCEALVLTLLLTPLSFPVSPSTNETLNPTTLSSLSSEYTNPPPSKIGKSKSWRDKTNKKNLPLEEEKVFKIWIRYKRKKKVG